MTLLSLKQYFIHINKFGYAAGKVYECPSDAAKDFVSVQNFIKFADAQSFFANTIEQIQSQINKISDEMLNEYNDFDSIEVLYYIHSLKFLVQKLETLK